MKHKWTCWIFKLQDKPAPPHLRANGFRGAFDNHSPNLSTIKFFKRGCILFFFIKKKYLQLILKNLESIEEKKIKTTMIHYPKINRVNVSINFLLAMFVINVWDYTA